MIPNAFIKSVSLRHSRVVKKFIIAATLYMFFVVIDIVRLKYLKFASSRPSQSH